MSYFRDVFYMCLRAFEDGSDNEEYLPALERIDRYVGKSFFDKSITIDVISVNLQSYLNLTGYYCLADWDKPQDNFFREFWEEFLFVDRKEGCKFFCDPTPIIEYVKSGSICANKDMISENFGGLDSFLTIHEAYQFFNKLIKIPYPTPGYSLVREDVMRTINQIKNTLRSMLVNLMCAKIHPIEFFYSLNKATPDPGCNPLHELSTDRAEYAKNYFRS